MKTELSIERCRFCNRELPRRAPGAGRPRRYCGDPCKNAAYRQRKLEAEYRPRPAFPETAPPPTPNPDEQAARAVLEARMLAAAFIRLSELLPPSLAWRFEQTGYAMQAVLADHFGEA